MANQRVDTTVGATIKRIFGGSKARYSVSSSSFAESSDYAIHARGDEERQKLLRYITSLILNNDLAITPANISAIQAALAGSGSSLDRQIASVKMANGRITDQWFENTAPHGLKEIDRKAEIDQLMAKLESGIDIFADMAKVAHDATGNYHCALEDHISELEGGNSAGVLLTNLAEIAKAMLERTRQLEEQMRRSVDEAISLRASLAKAQREAGIDHLTGLPNRRGFEGVLETHYRDAQREIEPLCVAICDIDHFKMVNDTHGHDAGDRVIQAVAQAFARISNENCHVARQGGEEFVMLFRGMTTCDALKRLDDVRERLVARKFINRSSDEPIGNITFSGGVADVFAYPDQHKALEAADAALYRAKNQGRNRIYIAEI